MHEIDVRPGAELFAAIAEGSLECRVHAPEVPVEVGDADQVRGEGEDPVELGLGVSSPPGVESQRSCEAGNDEPRGEDDPRQRSRSSPERWPRYDDIEPLSCLLERLVE